MENTTSTAPTKLSSDIGFARTIIRDFLLSLPTVYSHPSVRPPVLEEMQADIDRLITSLAHQYSDQTCMALHVDELVSEGNLKLAQLIHKGELSRQVNRTNFFRFFKTAVANHFRSLVQRHRFTFKRTGQRPPPRQRQQELVRAAHADVDLEYRKLVEVSLDDEEAGIQAADQHEAQSEESEMREDFESVLTPVERLVFRQMVEPDETARCLAVLDAQIKRKPGSIRIDIKHEHMAEALGVTEQFFAETVLRIREKISKRMAMTQKDHADAARRNMLIQQLSSVFGVQVPPNLDEIVVKRLFTLAARDQFAKVNAQVRDLLTELGASVPQPHVDGLACYGILYKRSDRRCMVCDLRQACGVEAANVGLGSKITISPKLLGTRNTRYPTVLPSEGGAPQTLDAESFDVVAYLDEMFTRYAKDGFIYYLEKASNSRRPLFCLERTNPVRLRFCNPSVSLTEKLIGKPKAWYPPDDIDSRALFRLIEEHAEEMFARNA